VPRPTQETIRSTRARRWPRGRGGAGGSGAGGIPGPAGGGGAGGIAEVPIGIGGVTVMAESSDVRERPHAIEPLITLVVRSIQ